MASGIDAEPVPYPMSCSGRRTASGRDPAATGPREAALAARAAGVPLRMAAKLRETAERPYFDWLA